MELLNSEFEYQKTKAKKLYERYQEIFCPYLNEYVLLNSKGFDHIRMKRWNAPRGHNEQLVRFRLLYFVPEILRKSSTLQGFRRERVSERIKIQGEWKTKTTNVYFYEFIAVIRGYRIRIIIKKVAAGQQPYFWSVIPYWKNGPINRKIYTGNPEED